MKYILQRILIGTGIALAVWFIKDTCFAATTVDQYVYRTRSYAIYSSTSSSVTCNTSSSSLSTFTTFGNGQTGPKCLTELQVRLGTPADSSKYFVPGFVYTVKFRNNFNPRRNPAVLFYTYAPSVLAFNGTDYVDTNTSLESFSYVVSNDSYGIEVTVRFSVSANTRYILLSFGYPDDFYGLYNNQGINFKDGSFSYTADAVVNAIYDQTSLVTSAINGVLAAIIAGQGEYTDLFDQTNTLLSTLVSSTSGIGGQLSDSTSLIQSITPSFVYDTQYDVLGRSIGTVVDDGLGETLTIDLSYWDDPFSFLWGIATEFINVDAKLFLVLTTILTFSFVGLVFNR